MDFYSPLYKFFIKQQKLFYKAASEAACGAAVKTKSIRFLPLQAVCHVYGTVK